MPQAENRAKRMRAHRLFRDHEKWESLFTICH